tara:strand:+ start:2495 stop:3742 length:1248 start_codon:yes stop_codon:yes gene_type:complete
MFKKIAIGTFTSILFVNQVSAVTVPGSVPPVQMTTSALYADASRGIAVPEHEQFRMQTSKELVAQAVTRTEGVTFSDVDGNAINPSVGTQQDTEISDKLEKIANDPGFLSAQGNPLDQAAAMQMPQSGFVPAMPMGQTMQGQMSMPMQAPMPAQAMMPTANTASFNQVNTGFKTVPTQTGAFQAGTTMADDGGVEIAVGRVQTQKLDLKNSLVKLREDRVSIRRVVRRMLDQIGGGSWNIVWSLSQENANLPDMEISIYTQEPFMNVLNALLARLQTRSGQSLRVIKYDNAQKLVITDQQGSITKHSKAAGVNVNGKVAVTEQVLKESKVTLHYDEIPLVDALENIVNQASNGQWRLRVYAGTDQVLKPAHIEEPFNIAMERILSLFNLKYEIFPGGKLVVVTSAGAASYTNMQQ